MAKVVLILMGLLVSAGTSFALYHAAAEELESATRDRLLAQMQVRRDALAAYLENGRPAAVRQPRRPFAVIRPLGGLVPSRGLLDPGRTPRSREAFRRSRQTRARSCSLELSAVCSTQR